MKNDDVTILNEQDVLRAAMLRRGTNQTKLADKMGMLRNGLSQNMSRKRISLEMFRRILDAMDYDVYVVDRKTNEVAWKVDV